MFKPYNRKGDLDVMSVIDYQAFKFYREHSKIRNEINTPDFTKHGKILSAFYKKIGEKMISSEGGVFIEKLGYFSGVIDSVKNFSFYREKVNLNRHTSGYQYFLIFVPIAKDNKLKEWVADSSFSLSVRQAFSQALKNGIKFTFNPSFFIKKYGMKKNKIK